MTIGAASVEVLCGSTIGFKRDSSTQGNLLQGRESKPGSCSILSSLVDTPTTWLAVRNDQEMPPAGLTPLRIQTTTTRPPTITSSQAAVAIDQIIPRLVAGSPGVGLRTVQTFAGQATIPGTSIGLAITLSQQDRSMSLQNLLQEATPGVLAFMALGSIMNIVQSNARMTTSGFGVGAGNSIFVLRDGVSVETMFYNIAFVNINTS